MIPPDASHLAEAQQHPENVDIILVQRAGAPERVELLPALPLQGVVELALLGSEVGLAQTHDAGREVDDGSPLDLGLLCPPHHDHAQDHLGTNDTIHFSKRFLLKVVPLVIVFISMPR
jgi:hypothetical protein